MDNSTGILLQPLSEWALAIPIIISISFVKINEFSMGKVESSSLLQRAVSNREAIYNQHAVQTHVSGNIVNNS